MRSFSVLASVASMASFAAVMALSVPGHADDNFSSISSTSDHDPVELEVGLRSGWMAPFGKIFSQSAPGSAAAAAIASSFGATLPDTTVDYHLSDTLSGAIPLSADLGFRVVPHLYIGGYFSYAFGILPSNLNCNSPASCSIHDIRGGIDVDYHFRPFATLDPWVGLGAGYESLGLSLSAGPTSVSESVSGFEFANISTGLDIRTSRDFGIGPFLMASFGEYGTGSFNGNSSSDFDKDIHGWFTVGVRAIFDVALGQRMDHLDGESSHSSDSSDASGPIAPSRPTRPLSPPPNTGPSAPQAVTLGAGASWPADVPRADRSTCTLACSSRTGNLAQTDTSRVQQSLENHLEAVRSCVQTTQRPTNARPPAVTVTFDAQGSGHAGVSLKGESDAFKACIMKLPAAAPISGPPNDFWTCEDACL